MDISDFFQFFGKTICNVKTWKKDQAVHFPCTAIFLINGTDLSADYKTGIKGTGGISERRNSGFSL